MFFEFPAPFRMLSDLYLHPCVVGNGEAVDCFPFQAFLLITRIQRGSRADTLCIYQIPCSKGGLYQTHCRSLTTQIDANTAVGAQSCLVHVMRVCVNQQFAPLTSWPVNVSRKTWHCHANVFANCQCTEHHPHPNKIGSYSIKGGSVCHILASRMPYSL